jgi:hypothetical protein
MNYQQSQRVASLFANASKSGGVYYSGKVNTPVTIPAGARISLVKSQKTASNGSEIWSLLVDPPGGDDQRRVLETRGDVDLDNLHGRMPPQPISDEIPF